MGKIELIKITDSEWDAKYISDNKNQNDFDMSWALCMSRLKRPCRVNFIDVDQEIDGVVHIHDELILSASLDNFKDNKAYSIEAYDEGAYIVYYKDTAIASFGTLRYSGNNCYFFEFEVKKEYRGKGHGTAIFSSACNYIKKLGYTGIKLQVSSENIPAYKLYKSFGLKTEASINYKTVLL